MGKGPDETRTYSIEDTTFGHLKGDLTPARKTVGQT
ncbi:hypothetical protein [Cellulosispirillum alkaliphilum]